MTAKPENYEELTRLISALLEGQLSEPERARLDALLQADPRARQLYMQMIDQEVELSCLLVPGGAQTDKHENILPLPQSLPTVQADPSPRRWRPWRLAAAAAVVLLIGTALALVLSRDPSRKETAIAPKLATTSPLVLDVWSEDFESGSSTGWYGQLVTNNLPAGSKYGIAAVLREYPGGESVYNIHLPENWDRGFVALTPESTLNVTYRLGNRTHVNVFMHTISPEPGERKYAMFQLRTGGGFPGRNGRWQTASIPFANFIRKVSVEPGGDPTFVGGLPKAGEPITALSFSSVEPSGLVIDRVWITPTGSAREEIVPLRN